MPIARPPRLTGSDFPCRLPQFEARPLHPGPGLLVRACDGCAQLPDAPALDGVM
jgi:hypothetical protein